MRETTKDVVIDGRNYRINKMPPFAASRIHNLLLMAGLRFRSTMPLREREEERVETEEKPEPPSPKGAIEFSWMAASTSLSEELYLQIQGAAIACCLYEINDGKFAPVVMADKRWADTELRDDGIAAGELVKESLIFNISPFFEHASKEVEERKSQARTKS